LPYRLPAARAPRRAGRAPHTHIDAIRRGAASDTAQRQQQRAHRKSAKKVHRTFASPQQFCAALAACYRLPRVAGAPRGGAGGAGGRMTGRAARAGGGAGGGIAIAARCCATSGVVSRIGGISKLLHGSTMRSARA
jgi:hypothetical protein